jgi:hypothetical protein
LPPDHPLVIEAQKHLDKMTADFERLKQLQEVRTAAWQAASQAKTNCEDWLRHAVPGNCTLEAVEIEEPKLNRGESLIDGIERHRRRVRELKADLHRIASAPFPSSHAKAQMRRQIEQLAERGEPSVSRLVELDGPVEFQTQRVQSAVYNAQQGAVAFHEAVDAAALFAFLAPEILIKRLDALIDAEADDKAALSHEARQKAEAEVIGDLLAVEFQESCFVWQAQSEGLPCEHRADCSPCAILGLRLVTTPRATELPETSPGLSWPMLR